MQFSDETLEIFKNFSTGNKSIIFHPGNIVRSRDALKTWFAEAHIAESFDRKVVLYNFGGFLDVQRLFATKPEVTFTDNFAVISDGKQQITFTLGAENETMIAGAPDQTPPFPTPSVEFDLDEETFSRGRHAVSMLGLDEVMFSAKNGVVTFKGLDRKNNSKNAYSVTIGEIEDKSADIDVILARTALFMLPRAYKVGLGRVVRFASPNLTYWLGALAPEKE